MIVVDTNIVAYLLLPGEWTAAAESLWISDGEWAAPLLWRSEFRNILAGYMRRGLLTLEHAQEVQAAAEDLLAGREFGVDSRSVLQLVSESQCSAYDCEFVALAQNKGCPLYTMDKKLLQQFPFIARDIQGR